MLDEWQQRFLAEGAVEVRLSAQRGLILVGAGAAFLAGAAFFFFIPQTGGVAELVGPSGNFILGLLSALMGCVGMAVGVRSLVNPLLVVRLDRDGVHVPQQAFVPWGDVEGVRTEDFRGQRFPVVATSEESARQRTSQAGLRGGMSRANARLVGAHLVPLRPGAQGSTEDLLALVAWARDQAVGSEKS